MYVSFKNVNIESFGVHLPDKIVTSLNIEEDLNSLYERLRLVPGRIELMTGIKERRKWPEGTIPSQIASVAGKRALENSKIDPNLIGALFNTSVCRDCLEPATANMVHNNIGLSKDCMVLDISNACLGFLNGMIFAAQLIESGSIKAALITAGENGSPLLDSTIKLALSNPNLTKKEFKKMFASFTIGSGAVAAVLTHSDISKTTHKFMGATVRNNTKSSNLCVGGGSGGTDTGATGGLLMETDSETLLIDGVKLANETWIEHQKNSNSDKNSIDHIFCHQVGIMHLRKLYNDLNIPIEKDYSTFNFLGNIGSVSLPLTMAMGIKERNVKANDNITMMGIGSGINCMMLSVKW
jgi:3-oxoacyl-[acyl-carrier-protein] synthase-3